MMDSWVSPDGKINKKEVLVKGQFGIKPNDWSECSITISETNLNCFKDFVKKNVIIGDNDGDLYRALDVCISTMFVGETSKFSIEIDNVNINLIIELHSLNFNGFIYQWDSKKKFEIATHHKIKGKSLFEQNNYKDAAFRFIKALKIVSLIPIDVEKADRIAKIDGVPLQDIKALKANLYNNLSSCYYRKDQWNNVIETCNKTLALNPNNVKALYKIGVAYEHDRNFEKAHDCFVRALELEPGNKSCEQHLIFVKKELKNAEAKINNMMKKMFEGAMEGV